MSSIYKGNVIHYPFGLYINENMLEERKQTYGNRGGMGQNDERARVLGKFHTCLRWQCPLCPNHGPGIGH